MKNQILFIVLCLGSCFLYLDSYSQITRGAQPGEIYMSNDWYWDGYLMHRAVYRSTDNGELVNVQYTSTNPPSGEDMMIGTLIGEPTIGCIYNCGPATNTLSVSFDHGVNWENRESYTDYTRYFTGEISGLIFRGNSEGFFKSTDYAYSFELLPISIICPFSEVGYLEAEFFGIYGDAGEEYFLVHTLDYGQTCIEIPIDSSVAYFEISSHSPKISRGASLGELYLVSWWPTSNYKIFHSVDNGYTWTEKYESEDINLYYWGVSFSAGREPGSFYVVRTTGDPTLSHLWLYIDYSSDYGETFTTYFHDMDSTFTSVDEQSEPIIGLSNFPNPFNRSTTISFQLPSNCKKPVLNIYDVHGKCLRQYDITGKNAVQWDGIDDSGNKVPKGMYFYNIKYNSYSYQINKLILTH